MAIDPIQATWCSKGPTQACIFQGASPGTVACHGQLPCCFLPATLVDVDAGGTAAAVYLVCTASCLHPLWMWMQEGQLHSLDSRASAPRMRAGDGPHLPTTAAGGQDVGAGSGMVGFLMPPPLASNPTRKLAFIAEVSAGW